MQFQKNWPKQRDVQNFYFCSTTNSLVGPSFATMDIYSRYNSTFYYYRYLLASSTCCTIIDTICCYQALRWRHQRTIGSSLVGKYLVESKTRTSVQPGMEYPLLRISVCHNSSKHKCLQLRAATVVLAGLGRDERAATELT